MSTRPPGTGRNPSSSSSSSSSASSSSSLSSIVLLLHVLLVLWPDGSDGAVRSGRVGGQFSSTRQRPPSTGGKSNNELRHLQHLPVSVLPAAPFLPMHPRLPGRGGRGGQGGKSYACPQDLTQSLPATWSVAVATPLMEDRTVPLIVDTSHRANDTDDTEDSSSSRNNMEPQAKRFTFKLPETSPLTINLMASCTRHERSFDPPIEWWVMREQRYVAALTSGMTFYRSCAQRGLYQVVVNVTGLSMATGCGYRLSYNRKGAEEYRSWPFRNLTAPSRIKVQQQRRRFVAMIKWEKSKLDIHAMQYCLAVSTGRRQRSLCQALGNTIHQSSCDSIAINEYLKRQLPRDERKMDPNAETTLVCTGSRTKQLIRGMKPNVTYFVDVFAIHSRHNNLSFLLGTTQVQLNRTRPTQLIEGKVVVGKLSTLGGLSLFSFKVPKRSQNNFFKLHVTPCGGSVNVEILKRKQHILDRVWDVYYPKTITVNNVRPGERYLIRVYEAEDTSRLNRIQVAVTSREEFVDLPRMPQNTTITELVPLRKCRSSTIAWFRSPDKDVTYCVYVFKLSKTQYYSNVKIPTYCELESRDVCNHPQFHNKHCFNNNEYNPLSLDIPNLQPEHYYSVFVTAIPARGRSLPYKSVRIKTASFCPDMKQLRSDRVMLTTKGGFRKGLANARNETSSQAAGHNSLLPDDARGGSKRRTRNRRLETTIQKT
ncbi:uncharacterized protein LOC126574900 [Anopheles aquasalis]|uniref:uncharacterized protein LOC126574900 n=1 Tax=Anopheles aquasalis TaxID=42839 RepID=UPI00215AB947|nr:uncharacterized protein LOC126574900 [Anopheles aquasalis]